MSKKILVIDDEETTRRVVQERLEKKGYFVITAKDGGEGLDKAGRGLPDLILLDVEMPQMNGYTFMLELQKREQLKDVPVIVLTSHSEVQPVFEVNGVSGYIVKPVDFKKLFAKVRTCLEGLKKE